MGRRMVAIPEGVLPGEKLELVMDTERLLVTVPPGAEPHMSLILDKSPGGWELTGVVKKAAAPLKVSVALNMVQLDGQRVWATLVSSVRKAGGYVNPKLDRTAVGLGLLGVVCVEPVTPQEELFRIPPSMCLSTSTLRECMPRLYDAAFAVKGLKERLRRESAQIACVARLLAKALDSVDAGCWDDVDTESDAHAAVRQAYCVALATEDFTNHPYWRAIDDVDALRAEMQPSAEWMQAKAMSTDVLGSFTAILQELPAEVLGGKFEAGAYFQAKLSMLTRVFHRGTESALVPAIDFINHWPTHTADWAWDESTGAMVVTSNRAHEAGEQVFISYGRRPNPLLLRTYGFTVPPEVEPSWCFVLQGEKRPEVAEVFKHFMPRKHVALVHLDSAMVQDSLVSVLNGVAGTGGDAAEFLWQFCEAALAAYEEDPTLQPMLDALKAVRSVDAPSAEWWTTLASHDRWSTDCIRTKMSEYLALVSHREIAGCFLRRVTPEVCLRQAATMRELLLTAFEELERVGHFSCTSRPA